MSKDNILDGKALSALKIEQIAGAINTFKQKTSHIPTLAVVLVGSDAASKTYVNRKAKACQQVGIHSILHEMPQDISAQEIIATIKRMNKDPRIDGILVQLPLPHHISEEEVIKTIKVSKDVDGFTPFNTGALWTNTHIDNLLTPATPLGVIELLQHYNITVAGKEVVIVGASNIVGKPLAALFLQLKATVSLCHMGTQGLSNHTKRADILCSATGKQHLITADMVKEGAVVIDIGIVKVGDKIYGDVDFDGVAQVASHITPVPGGVGPMTICTLLSNTLKAAQINYNKQRNKKEK